MKNQEIIQNLEKLETKLPPTQKDYNPKFAYLYTKAALLYFKGAAWYKSNDYFGYPSKHWNRKPLYDIADQIANHMCGLSSDNPIHVKSLAYVFQSVTLFHFEVITFEIISEMKLLKVGVTHIIDKEPLTLYYRVSGGEI